MQHEIRPNAEGVFPRLVNGPHRLALGNGTAYDILVFKTNGVLYLGIEGVGCYHFALPPDVAYVAEKFRLDRVMGDAMNLTDFVWDQIAPGAPRQGRYS